MESIIKRLYEIKSPLFLSPYYIQLVFQEWTTTQNYSSVNFDPYFSNRRSLSNKCTKIFKRGDLCMHFLKQIMIALNVAKEQSGGNHCIFAKTVFVIRIIPPIIMCKRKLQEQTKIVCVSVESFMSPLKKFFAVKNTFRKISRPAYCPNKRINLTSTLSRCTGFSFTSLTINHQKISRNILKYYLFSSTVFISAYIN